MDILQLKDLPLPIAIIVICFWFLNQNNTEFSKKIAGMVDQFTAEYKEMLATVLEERRQTNATLFEQNRQLMTIAQTSAAAVEKSANEIHTLRNYIQPLVLSVQNARKQGNQGRDATRGGGGESGGAD